MSGAERAENRVIVSGAVMSGRGKIRWRGSGERSGRSRSGGRAELAAQISELTAFMSDLLLSYRINFPVSKFQYTNLNTESH